MLSSFLLSNEFKKRDDESKEKEPKKEESRFVEMCSFNYLEERVNKDHVC